MKRTLGKDKKILLATGMALAIALVIVLGAAFAHSRFNIFPQLISSRLTPKDAMSFPEIDETQLSDDQLKLVTVLKKEYTLNPEGTKYSEGVHEAWCADFVSWVYREAGKPLKNPNSGSWRIPGTYTLREYYQSTDVFRAAGSQYTPKLGDVLLYDNPSPFGQHTNIVLKSNNGIVTTIGGNEPGGIRVIKHSLADDPGFIGYGVY